MVLHAKEWQRAMPDALVRVIVQVQVRHLNLARRQRVRIHAEAVILSRDLHLTGEQILDRMIRTVMSEFQLERLSAEGEATQLVPEANPEDGHAPDKLADVCNRIGDGLGVAGAVRQENTARLHREDIFAGSSCWNDGDFAAVIHEQSQDVSLDSEIVSNNAILARRRQICAS